MYVGAGESLEGIMKTCTRCGKKFSAKYKGKRPLCVECRRITKQEQEQTDALARFADAEMFGDDADYHEASGLEFGNK